MIDTVVFIPACLPVSRRTKNNNNNNNKSIGSRELLVPFLKILFYATIRFDMFWTSRTYQHSISLSLLPASFIRGSNDSNTIQYTFCVCTLGTTGSRHMVHMKPLKSSHFSFVLKFFSISFFHIHAKRK
jgi:hypothetical protein